MDVQSTSYYYIEYYVSVENATVLRANISKRSYKNQIQGERALHVNRERNNGNYGNQRMWEIFFAIWTTDSFKKIAIVDKTMRPWRNEEGFLIMGMKYFLLNADSLEF